MFNNDGEIMSFKYCLDIVNDLIRISEKIYNIVERARADGIELYARWAEIASRGYPINVMKDLVDKLRMEIMLIQEKYKFKPHFFELDTLKEFKPRYDETCREVEKLVSESLKLLEAGRKEEVEEIGKKIIEIRKNLISILNALNNLVKLEVFMKGQFRFEEFKTLIEEFKKAYTEKNLEKLFNTVNRLRRYLFTFFETEEYVNLMEETYNALYSVSTLEPKHFTSIGMKVPETVVYNIFISLKTISQEVLTWLEKYLNYIYEFIQARREFRFTLVKLLDCLLNSYMIEKFSKVVK